MRDQDCSAFVRAVPGTTEPVRSSARKRRSPSSHRADAGATAAPLNLAALLIGSRGRGAEPCQGKMEWLSEQTADGGMQRQSGERGGLCEREGKG